MALVMFGTDRPLTTRMIATTTINSVSVKPDCESRVAFDLAIDFTVRALSVSRFLRKNFTQSSSNSSGQSTRAASANFGVAYPNLREKW
jgi:hypothetical protein